MTSMPALAVRRSLLEVKRYRREPLAMALTFAYPVFMLIIFAAIFGKSGLGMLPAGASVTFAQYFLPGMIATGIVLTGFQQITQQIAADREAGALKRLRGTPLPPLSYFLGIVGQVFVASFVQIACLLAVACLVFDVPLPQSGSQWWTLVWLFLLGNACCTLCAVAFSSLLSSGRTAAGVTVPVVLILQFLSGVFFPFSSLPTWMQAIASFFPLRWLAEGMRSVFLPNVMANAEPGGGWHLPEVALWLSAWLIVALLIAVRFFSWTRRGER